MGATVLMGARYRPWRIADTLTTAYRLAAVVSYSNVFRFA